MSNKKYNVAVVGATGAVGQQIIRTLAARQFPINELKLLSSARSAGTELSFNGQTYRLEEATPESFKGVDIALFSAGGAVSRKLAPEAVKHGALVIDNTSAFRMDPQVPLVVPEVNPEDIAKHQGIIANPNCSTIQMVVALKPLADRFGLKRIVVSTYQAVSGAGTLAIDELKRQAKAVLEEQDFTPDILPVGGLPRKHQIAFNAVPQIDVFEENGFTFEELKMINETKKIMHNEQIEIAATCVRIPVVTGHSESVYAEFEKDIDVATAKAILSEAPGVIVEDHLEEQLYPLATTATGKNEVFVGRLRQDLNRRNGLHLWIVSDNLLKGAAWNSVQIAEYYIAQADQN